MMNEPLPHPPTAGLIRYLPMLAIAAIALAGAFTLRDYLSFETLRANREILIGFKDSNYLLTAVGFMAIYILLVAFSLPGASIATLTGGFMFGVFPGALFNVTAATIGACIIFMAARMGLGERLSAKLDAGSGAIKRIKDGIRENELSVLLLMRLVPAVPFFVANLIPALVGVSLQRFALTTFLGIIPGAIVYTWVGAGLGDVFERGDSPDLGILFEPQIIGPIIGLCVLAVLPILLKLFRKKGTQL